MRKLLVIFGGLILFFIIILSILSSFTLTLNGGNEKSYVLTYYIALFDKPSAALNMSESNLIVEQLNINNINGNEIIMRMINQKTSVSQLNKFNNYLGVIRTSNNPNIEIKFFNILIVAILLTTIILTIIFICKILIQTIYKYVDVIPIRKMQLLLIIYFVILYLIGVLFNSSVQNFQTNSDNLIYMKYYFNNINIPSQVAVYNNQQLVYIEDLIKQNITPNIVSSNCETFSTGLCYKPYVSSFGLQAIIFKFLGEKLHITSIIYFRLLCQIIEILCLSLVLVEIILVFYKRFNKSVLMALWLGFSFTYILAKFAPSVYWNIWIMLIPFLISSKYMLDKESHLFMSKFLLFLGLGLSFLFKMLFGYEWITTLVLSAMIPLLWDGENIVIKNRLILFIQVGITAILSFILSLLLWWWQLGSDAFYSAFISDLVRWVLVFVSHNNVQGAEIYVTGVSANVFSVIMNLLLYPDYFISFGFYFIITVFFIISYLNKKYIVKDIKVLQKVIVISLVAPLSWFILAKSHSYVHAYLNYILWLIPSGIYIYVFFGMLYHSREVMRRMILSNRGTDEKE